MICREVSEYINAVENGNIVACEDQHRMAAHVRKCFAEDGIYTDTTQLAKYLGLAKYFQYDQLFPWEKFILALHACTYYKDTGLPRWPDLFVLIGRGAGKDGFIAFEAMCLLSQYNGIARYDVDICANNEEQATTPVADLVLTLEAPANQKLKNHFYWTKERVRSLITNSVVRGRTNNPAGKDGLRSGCVIFNEVHQYPDYRNIKVFTTGLGKKKHPRKAYFTTQGDVTEGVLDDLIQTSEMILAGEKPDDGFLPFVCRLDDKNDVHDKSKWAMANPSLPYFPTLQAEMEKEYAEGVRNPEMFAGFMTKRMNIRTGSPEIKVTAWDNIAKTDAALPDLSGWPCVAGIDYAMLSDFASVNLHFWDGTMRYDINHSWICTQSKDLPRIKAPWENWAGEGLLTIVDAPLILPEMIAEYIARQSLKYGIQKIAMDNFRFAMLAQNLEAIGFSSERKNIRLVRPSDIMSVAPIIDSCFATGSFAWGDNPVLRWAANNTKLIRSSRRQGSDTGNFYYGKIEGRSRKTDPFMALVASMVIEGELAGSAYCESDFEVYVM
jgi:phage terminase large subunit-like protein